MLRKLLALFFCAFLVTTAEVQAADISVAPALRKIFAVFETAKSRSRANQELNSYIALHPKDGNAYTVRCLFWISEEPNMQGLSSGAVDCKKGVALSPRSLFARLEFGNILRISGNYSDALVQYTRAIDLGLTDANVYEYRCIVLRHLGRAAEAISDCNRQLVLTPSSYSARVARGEAELGLANYVRASGDFAKAISLEPFKARAFELRAQTDATIGRYRSAETELTQLISQGTRNPLTYFERAMMRAELGKKARSLSDLQLAKKLWTAAGYTAMVKTADAQIKQISSGTFSPWNIAPSGPVTLFGEHFTAAEVHRLMHGLYAGFDPYDQTVQISSHRESDKKHLRWPLYEATLSDLGIVKVTVVVPTGQKAIPRNRAYNGAVLLGLAASGYAGPKWRALYNEMYARDKQLPTNAPDPYLNRRAMANALVALYKTLAVTKPR